MKRRRKTVGGAAVLAAIAALITVAGQADANQQEPGGKGRSKQRCIRSPTSCPSLRIRQAAGLPTAS